MYLTLIWQYLALRLSRLTEQKRAARGKVGDLLSSWITGSAILAISLLKKRSATRTLNLKQWWRVTSYMLLSWDYRLNTPMHSSPYHFNHASLASTLPNFHQFVDYPTRKNRTLVLLNANVKGAYSATALPPLGKSDHNLVCLLPFYKPLVQWQPLTTRTIRKHTCESDETLGIALSEHTGGCWVNHMGEILTVSLTASQSISIFARISLSQQKPSGASQIIKPGLLVT